MYRSESTTFLPTLPSALRLGATLLLAFVLVAGALAPTARAAADARADELLRSALGAMGGESLLRELHSVRVAGVMHSNMLEQSERPEGPYIVAYADFDERRDLDSGRWEQTANTRSIVSPGFELTTIVDDGAAVMKFGERAAGGSGDSVVTAEDSLAFGPERVLLNALAAGDAAHAGTVEFQGTAHEAIDFTWNGTGARLYLNAHTRLPTAVEWTRYYPYGLWAAWGDVRTRLEYSLWHLEEGGLMYPRQWTETRNGLPASDRTILELELNPAAPAEPFVISDELRASFEARRDMSGADAATLGVDFRGQHHEGEEIVPGLVQIRGMWNVALIDQPDGIVVLEAPISPAYSTQVIDEVERRFPGRDILAVISTSDAWPHLAGVREYLARDIPVYAFAGTVPLLERLAAAPRASSPDRMERDGGNASSLVAVDGPLELGAGPNRMIVRPIRGEGGERMLSVYFPEHRLLYASDLIQRSQGQFFMPSYLAEVEMLIERAGFAVDTTFAMHLAPTAWSEVADALRQIRSGGPAGSE